MTVGRDVSEFFCGVAIAYELSVPREQSWGFNWGGDKVKKTQDQFY